MRPAKQRDSMDADNSQNFGGGSCAGPSRHSKRRFAQLWTACLSLWFGWAFPTQALLKGNSLADLPERVASPYGQRDRGRVTGMTIDLVESSESELIDLDHRIVASDGLVAQLWHTCCLKTAQDGTSHLT
jgi:hypothetical protein